MTKQTAAVPADPISEGTYARIERERRFLLAGPPLAPAVTATRRITDRYLAGTRLRLRRAERPDRATIEYKLTQKVPADQPGPVQGLITNTYLSQAEYNALASLPAAVLSKTRFSVPPLGIDVFDPPLHGLILAEAEFATNEAAHSYRPPASCIAEVTDDARFTGGNLVQADRQDLLVWLAEYGITPNPTTPPTK
jgi:CYTH domain-containing protein